MLTFWDVSLSLLLFVICQCCHLQIESSLQYTYSRNILENHYLLTMLQNWWKLIYEWSIEWQFCYKYFIPIWVWFIFCSFWENILHWKLNPMKMEYFSLLEDGSKTHAKIYFHGTIFCGQIAKIYGCKDKKAYGILVDCKQPSWNMK